MENKRLSKGEKPAETYKNDSIFSDQFIDDLRRRLDACMQLKSPIGERAYRLKKNKKIK